MNSAVESNPSGLGVLIAAGGASRRFGETSKLWSMVEEKPLWVYPLEAVLSVDDTLPIVLVVPEEEIKVYQSGLRRYFPHARIGCIPGGKTRPDSVRNGLEFLKPFALQAVVILDAARPLLTPDLFSHCVKTFFEKEMPVIACGKVNDTVKRYDPHHGKLQGTVDRRTLLSAQTPQIFPFETLCGYYEHSDDFPMECTDEAMAFEFNNQPIHPYIHAEPNIKLTFPADLILIRAVLQNRTLRGHVHPKPKGL